MIAVDTNILVYAHRKDSEWFESASAAIRGLAEGQRPWAIPWPCIHEFLAVITHPRIYNPPTPMAAAVQQVGHWMSSPSFRAIGEMPGHWKELARMLSAGKIRGGGVHDTRIAAICVEHGVQEFWTMDRDFGRIAGFQTANPLLP